MPTEVMILQFTTPDGADQVLDVLKDIQAQNFIELLDAIIVTKDGNQQVNVRQPLAVGPGRGAAFGALTGAVVGLLGGPAGVIVGFVSGAVTGGTAAAVMESGLPEDDIRELAANELLPGESALMVYYDQVWVEQIEDAIADFDASVSRQVLADERQAEREHAAEVRKEKIDAAYQSWQATIARQRAELTSLRQQIHTDAQADRQAIQERVTTARARLNEQYSNILHTLRVWYQQLDAAISQLEVEARQATAQKKADVEQRLASAKQARETARADAKATLTTRLNNLKSEIESLKTQAATSQGEAKARLNQRIDQLQADWDAEEKRLDQLDDADGQAWDTMVNSIDEAINSYEIAAGEAEQTYATAV